MASEDVELGAEHFGVDVREEGASLHCYAPDPGASARIVWDAMATEGKGKGKGGAACVGEVPVSGGVTIMGIE